MSKDDDARLANIYTASPPYLRYPERNNLSQFPVTVSLLCYRSHPNRSQNNQCRVKYIHI